MGSVRGQGGSCVIDSNPPVAARVAMGGSRAVSVGVWAAAVAAAALALGAATAAVAFYQAALTTDFCRRLCAPQPRQVWIFYFA